VVLVANNLNDLDNASTALTNLGLSANAKTLVTAANFAAMRTALVLVPQTSVTDATAGRLLTPGAFGLGQVGIGPLLANINATTIPGSLARFDGTTTGTKPAGVATGTVLTVRGAGTNNLSQLVLSGDGLQLWFRACVAGVFSAWRQPTPPELTQLQAENPASTVFGTVSGQRLGQAARVWGYTSAATTLPAAGAVLTFTHGLGAKPTRWLVTLVCTTANVGYAVGDELELPAMDITSGGYVSNGTTFVNATTIKIAKSSIADWTVTTGTGGGAGAAITNASWRIVARASL
jgi:hypothetical protein